jgi:hypothetical protein
MRRLQATRWCAVVRLPRVGRQSAVRSDEPNVDDPIGVIDPHHDAILIAGDVEHHTAIPEDAGAPDGTLYVS